jgi:LAS superfamily LD-carboxypeptidase LdcB
MERQSFTRRDFLKFSALALGSLAFKDLPKFLKDENLELPQAEDPLLIHLVDEQNPVTEDFIGTKVEPNLRAVAETKVDFPYQTVPVRREDTRLHHLCLPDLSLLTHDCWRDTNILPYVAEGFRSLWAQEVAYDKNNQDGRYVAGPLRSQHHTGLAIDFTSPENSLSVHSSSGFEDTKVGQWLKKNAWKYGFVESYINNHDGRIQEPWHYLYIGKELASFYQLLKQEGWEGDVFDLQALYPQI